MNVELINKHEINCIKFFHKRFTRKKICYYMYGRIPDGLLPNVNSLNGIYFSQSYHSIVDYLNYHSEIFKVSRIGKISCVPYANVEQYIKNVLLHKIQSTRKCALEQSESIETTSSNVESDVSSVGGDFQITDSDGFEATGCTTKQLPETNSKTLKKNESGFLRNQDESLYHENDLQEPVLYGNGENCEKPNINNSGITSFENTSVPNLSKMEISGVTCPIRTFSIESRLTRIVKDAIESQQSPFLLDSELPSAFIAKITKSHLQYFLETYVSLKEFLIFHSDVFKVDQIGQVHCADYQKIRNYLLKNCLEYKILFPDKIEKLEKWCIRKIWNNLSDPLHIRSIHEPDLNNIFSKATLKQKDYFWGTYPSIQRFIKFHREIFSVKPNGQICCISKVKFRKYLKNNVRSKLEKVGYHYSKRRNRMNNLSRQLRLPSPPSLKVKNDMLDILVSEKNPEAYNSIRTDIIKMCITSSNLKKKDASAQTLSTGPVLSIHCVELNHGNDVSSK